VKSPDYVNYDTAVSLFFESVQELGVQQRMLTDDEISDARAMVGWQFWAAPIMFGIASLGLGVGALGRNPAVIFVFLLICGLAVIVSLSRFRDYNKVSHDIEMRVVEVIEGTPDKVWIPRSGLELTRAGFCYLRLAGHTIRVPPDAYGELREANTVKVAFLPTAMVAVRVEPVRGLGRL
jgi:hypothetical protein